MHARLICALIIVVVLMWLVPSSKAQPVYINEFLASNVTTNPDIVDFDDYSDWIELFNAGDSDVDLIIDNVMTVAIEHAAKRQQTHTRERGRVVGQAHVIGGDLFADELIEWLVVVKRTNNIIAIRVRKRSNSRVSIHQNAILRVRIPRHV